MADELAGEITALEDDIKAEMTARQVEELQIDVFKIRYKTVKSRRFDSKTFKAANEALYNQYRENGRQGKALFLTAVLQKYFIPL